MRVHDACRIPALLDDAPIVILGYGPVGSRPKGTGNDALAGDGTIARRRLTLGYLTAFFATSHVERHIIAIALPAIGVEFALNDAQLGVLSGIAFSLVFAAGAVPLGMTTAFMDRRHVIAASIFLWSAMTALSGLATGFAFLLLTRIGVGLAGAAGVPAAHRAVSETQPESAHVRSFAVFNAGANIGIALALVGGGILVQLYGWRVAMIVAGLPGLVLAGLAWPAMERGAAMPESGHGGARTLLREAASAVLSAPHKRLAFLGVVLTSVITYGTLAWLPSFLIRAHGMSAQETGIFLALALGVGGTLGTVAGGHAVSRAARRNPAMTLWLPMLALLACKPLIIVAMLTESAMLARWLLVPPLMVGALHFVSALAVLHEGLEGRTRLMVSAFLLTCGNLIGYTLGPLIIGVGSWLMADAVPGGERIGHAMIGLQVLSALGLYAYWRAGFAYASARG